jgi:hypothetical protein
VVLWGIAGIALLIAVVALWLARRTARKLDALTQSYWELRYDYTRLRSVVSRVDPGEAPGPGADEPPAPAPSQVTFVPLSSMKKKNG